MPEFEFPASFWIVSGTSLFLLFLLWIGQLRQGARLRRIEARLIRAGGAVEGASKGCLADQKQGKIEKKRLYRQFLEEDPKRQELTKKDQFEAFRKWRSEKGLNWTPESAGEDKPA
ncbi:MAG: hypothetical protein AAGB14_05835 [Verrucomicrobiota bacterium]